MRNKMRFNNGSSEIQIKFLQNHSLEYKHEDFKTTSTIFHLQKFFQKEWILLPA